MEKSEQVFYVAPLGTETNQPEEGCQSSQRDCVENGYKSPDGQLPETLEYPANMPPPPPAYQSQYQNPAPPPGYEPQSHQQQGYQTTQFAYPVQTVVPAIPPQKKIYTWREDVHRNKPQSNSLSAASLIFTAGGMSFAQSTGIEPVMNYDSKGEHIHMQICWFVAVIIGAIVSTALVQILQKRIFFFVSGLLVVVSGIIFVSTPNNVVAIIIARYLNGVAFGLTLIPAIVAGSEQPVKRFRGIALSIEQMGLTSGITLQVVYSSFWESYWNLFPNQMHGIVSILQGVGAVLLTYFMTLESAVFHLRKNNETEALEVLRKSQIPNEVTEETHERLNENKTLLEEDAVRGNAVNVSAGLLPVIKICVFRVLVSISFSIPLTWAFMTASDANNSYWGPYSYALVRFIGLFTGVILIDRVGRKLWSIICLVMCGMLLIPVGVILYSDFQWYPQYASSFNAIIGLLLAFQLFAGITAPASTAYLGEAFSLSVKPYFILASVFVENIVQIVICCSFTNTFQFAGAFGYILGGFQLVWGVVFFFTMPETKQIPLGDALAKFKENLYFSLS